LQKIKEIKELTGIRFFAAFHVIFFHNFYISGTIVDHTPAFIKRFFSFGDSAVAFFFILSGFILSYVYVNSSNELKTSKKTFAWARFSRLYPIYILALLFDLPRGITYFISTYDMTTAVTKIVVSLSAYLTMLQSWYPRVTASWNSPAWSLSVEAFFYCVFPFVIPFIFKIKSNLKMMFLLYLIPILLFSILKYGVHINFDSSFISTLWRSFPALRLSEFLIGVVLGKVLKERGSGVQWIECHKGFASAIFWACLIFSLGIACIDLNLARELRMNIFLIPCFSLIILLLATTQIKGTGVFRTNIVVLLGNASFTLYIIHQPVLYYMNLLGFEKGVTYFSLYCCACIVLSLTLYKYFEVPMQKLLRKRKPFN
jgi:peptidoglycan/LPS O-acetylase OafA/YrhL